MPDPIPLRPRRDGEETDMRSPVQLGDAEPQLVPAPAINPFLAPDWPPDDEPA
jgi:hypothetical protein